MNTIPMNTIPAYRIRSRSAPRVAAAESAIDHAAKRWDARARDIAHESLVGLLCGITHGTPESMAESHLFHGASSQVYTVPGGTLLGCYELARSMTRDRLVDIRPLKAHPGVARMEFANGYIVDVRKRA